MVQFFSALILYTKFKFQISSIFLNDFIQIDTVAQEDSINDTHGLKALLQKKGHENFVFPPDVKAYINSHFRMIREENLRLSQSLEKANNQLKELKKGSSASVLKAEKAEKPLHEDLKSLKNQLEREKAKNKAMLKRLRLNENQNQNQAEVIWMQQVSSISRIVAARWRIIVEFVDWFFLLYYNVSPL